MIKNKTIKKIIKLLSSLSLPILFLIYFGFVAIVLIPDVLSRNLIGTVIDPLSSLLIVFIGLMTIVILLSFIPFSDFPTLFKNLGSKKWFSLCFFLMFVIFLVGTITLDSVYGYKPVSWQLNINGDTLNKYAGGSNSFFCNTASGKIFVGSNASCTTFPKINFKNASITFTFESGEVKKFDFTNSTFIAEPNTIYVFVEINGTTLDNKPIFVTTGVQPRFYTHEMQDKFITYLVGLLGAILFSVPIAVEYLKKLWRN
jgi:hypothetical protein